jgi:hypothetical protein
MRTCRVLSTHPRHNLAPIIALVLVISACGIPLGVAEDGGESGGDPCFAGGVCNGVNVWCQNYNQAGEGADVTGADDGAEPNYWWKSCDQPWEFPTLGCGADDAHCCTSGFGACFCKVMDEGTDIIYVPSVGPVCVGDGFPVAFDPIADWMTGNYPGDAGEVNDAIRAFCSERCETMPGDELGSTVPPQCEDANWSGVQTYPNWGPGDGVNCVVTMELNKDDPDGSDIPWELVGGPTTPVPLACSLNGSCVDWFYPHVAAFVLTPGSADFIDPETRTAHNLAVERTGSNVALDLDMPGTAAGVDDTEPLFGLAEYTALDCGDVVCPFYLANLTAFNTLDSWEIQVMTDLGTRLKKSISDVQIDLLQSALGVHHVALDKVAFAPGTLRLRVQVTVANNGSSSTYGDGTHAAIIENDDYVFADYDAGSLTLAHAFEVQNGEATLTIAVDPVDYPPVAAHDLVATEACDDPGGLALDGSHILSTDPDNDIEFDMWWIDGLPCWNQCALPFGSHQVSLEARDSRGAVHRTTDQWVYVVPGCS